MPFTMVPFRSLATLQNLKSQLVPDGAVSGGHRQSRLFLFVCCETVDPNATLHARMIFYNGEDPGHRMAAGCCTAWAVQHG